MNIILNAGYRIQSNLFKETLFEEISLFSVPTSDGHFQSYKSLIARLRLLSIWNATKLLGIIISSKTGILGILDKRHISFYV